VESIDRVGTVLNRRNAFWRRSHDVPEGHFQAGVSVVLLVDRLASYQAMAPVKAGLVVLAFCWAHVRRDFIAVAKSFPELKPWALAWLRRIRQGRPPQKNPSSDTPQVKSGRLLS
jgi:hypothetical protein